VRRLDAALEFEPSAELHNASGLPFRALLAKKPGWFRRRRRRAAALQGASRIFLFSAAFAMLSRIDAVESALAEMYA